MLRERRQGHVEWPRQFAHGGGPLAQALEYGAPGRVGQGLEDLAELGNDWACHPV